MKNVVQHLQIKSIPNVWLYSAICVALISIFTTFIFENQDLVHGLLLATHPILIIGAYKGFRSFKEFKISRLILSIGVGLIITAQSLQHLIYFKVPISVDFCLFVEEIGIFLITIFAYIHILMFEKKFNIKGFAIDYSLLIISTVFLLLLVSTELVHLLIYSFTLYQQLAVFNFFIGMTVLSMSVIHFLLTRSIGLTDGVRMILTVLLVVHFGLEIKLSFEKIYHDIFINTLSLSVYHIAGALLLIFIFIEDLSLEFSSIAPSRVGNVFMWISSIFAILAIPIGLVIRSTLDAPPLDLLIIGMTSILVSTIVIWRLIILIKNSNKQKERLNSLITTNSLTGLPNYQGYLEKLTLSGLKNILIAHINIEDFKSINDLYGRDVGDDVLKNIALKLKKLPESLLASHIQSDQFLVAFQTDRSDINSLIESVQEYLGVWDTVQGRSLAVPLTIGASFSETLNPEKLAKQAEIALKQARQKHSSFELFNEDRKQERIPRHELRQILQTAVDTNYLPVHFQPIYNLQDGSLKSLELLIRVDSKEHGLLLPGQFLEQAKSYALLTALTQVCIKMIAKHRKEIGDINVNINLPPYMLRSNRLLNNFIQSFVDEKLEPQKFCIEITEDEDIHAHELIPAIKTLKEQGFTIAMDDFGTGYSSLDRLSVLDVDTVKIDRSILLTSESGNNTILEWAISLTKRLGVSVVVEGVETIEQLALIKLLGADSVQGYLYSKPLPALQINTIPLNSSEIKVT